MADIFQEVDEEVRRDRAVALWKRYGTYVLAAAVVLVAATAGWSAWRYYMDEQRHAASTRFTEAMILANQGENDAAARVFAEVAAEAPGGYAVLARMEEAALKARAGDRAGAVAIYDRVAADSGAPQALRDVAVLLSAMQASGEADPGAVAERLAPLAAEGPWRHLARELQAALALRAGDRDRAKTILKQIAEDPGVPAGVKARSGELLAALGG